MPLFFLLKKNRDEKCLLFLSKNIRQTIDCSSGIYLEVICLLGIVSHKHSLFIQWSKLKRIIISFQEFCFGASLVAQWLRLLPANAGDTGSSPGLGRSHMPRSN